jgi:hypothetical protein
MVKDPQQRTSVLRHPVSCNELHESEENYDVYDDDMIKLNSAVFIQELIEEPNVQIQNQH